MDRGTMIEIESINSYEQMRKYESFPLEFIYIS
jgi:hypothetical protein